MDRFNHVIKQEGEEDMKEVSINNEEKQQDNDVKKKKNEEDDCAYIGLWDKDCGCKRCTRNRNISKEFNQTNATNERVKGSLGPFKKDAPFQCKRVKKEEDDDDAEWDEDCDCDHCRTMRLKDMRLRQTNATENKQTISSELANDEISKQMGYGKEVSQDQMDVGTDGDVKEKENESEGRHVRNDGDLDRHNEENCDAAEGNQYEFDQRENGQECIEGQMSDESEDDETVIDDEEYEMEVGGGESSNVEDQVPIPTNQNVNIDFTHNSRSHSGSEIAQKIKDPIVGAVCSSEQFQCRFVCEDDDERCTEKFYSKSHRRHHEINTHRNYYVCPRCKIRFESLVSLKGHINAKKGKHRLNLSRKNGLVYCDYSGCNQIIPDSLKARQLHHYTVHANHPYFHPYICTGCYSTFTCNGLLFNHLQVHFNRKNHPIKTFGFDRNYGVIIFYPSIFLKSAKQIIALDEEIQQEIRKRFHYLVVPIKYQPNRGLKKNRVAQNKFAQEIINEDKTADPNVNLSTKTKIQPLSFFLNFDDIPQRSRNFSSFNRKKYVQEKTQIEMKKEDIDKLLPEDVVYEDDYANLQVFRTPNTTDESNNDIQDHSWINVLNSKRETVYLHNLKPGIRSYLYKSSDLSSSTTQSERFSQNESSSSSPSSSSRDQSTTSPKKYLNKSNKRKFISFTCN